MELFLSTVRLEAALQIVVVERLLVAENLSQQDHLHLHLVGHVEVETLS